MSRRLLLLVPLLLVVGALGFFLVKRNGATAAGLAASGTVEATEADMGFQASGRIVSISVHEGDRVTAGEELGRLDDTEMQARLQAMRAQVNAVKAQLSELERGPRAEEIAQARAAAAAAQSRLADANRELERAQTLFNGGAISREALDRAGTAAQVASAQYDQARESLAQMESGTRPERIAGARAAVQQAEAGVQQIAATLANMKLTAPFAGVVTVRHREPGEVVSAGLPVVTIMNPADRWVRIYVPETAVGRIAIGAKAAITSDTDPAHPQEGEVTFIASEAEFTPRNVQTAEERVKLVYAVKVRIKGDPQLQTEARHARGCEARFGGGEAGLMEPSSGSHRLARSDTAFR